MFRKCRAPVAQLDRVSASEAEGRGFESRRARQKSPFGDFFVPDKRDKSPRVGSASGSERRGDTESVERPPQRGERSEQSRRDV